MKKRLKINGVIMFLALLVITIFPKTFFRLTSNEYSFDKFAEILGLALILLGQIIRTSSRGFKSENSKEGRTLVHGGPYIFVRNPMYLGILSIGLGVTLMLFKWWVVGVFLAIFIIRYILLIFTEEKKLRSLFPQEYQAYCLKVPRLFPSPSSIIRLEASRYLPLKLLWVKREIGSILAVLFGAMILASWKDINTYGLEVYFQGIAPIFITIILFIGFVVYLSKRI